MDNIQLITYPDLVHTGFQIALINMDPEQQLETGNMLIELLEPINVYNLNLELHPHASYNLSVLKQADLIIFNRPNLWHWLTGYVLSKPNCFYIEGDTTASSNFRALSLRQVELEKLKGLVENGIQRKRRQQADL